MAAGEAEVSVIAGRAEAAAVAFQTRLTYIKCAPQSKLTTHGGKDVYLVPATIGAMTALVMSVVGWRALAKMVSSIQPTTQKGAPTFSKPA